jgi:hypothetical protein
VTETEEVPELEAERELDHDEYDPTGTAALVVVYLAIIALMCKAAKLILKNGKAHNIAPDKWMKNHNRGSGSFNCRLAENKIKRINAVLVISLLRI